jgi:hypothetical protein
MTARPTKPHWQAPPLFDPEDCVAQAAAFRDSGWSVFCCTAYVGMSDSPQEYVEPHWLIAAIEQQGWTLQQLDYLCIELDRYTIAAQYRPSSRIEAKLMFRRDPAPSSSTEGQN